MKMQVTRWRPDTCGCILEYEWDSDLPIEKRVHTFHKAAHVCKSHAHVKANIFEVVLADNRKKNLAKQ